MKLDIITSKPEFVRYEKKNFVDLALLLQDFSIEELLKFYRQKNPNVAFPERVIIEALQTAELADKKPHSRMLKPMDWPDPKHKIYEVIMGFLKREFY